ncbi:hypothetical protein ABAC460_19105 [Asticcacaulis sp. AC460]|nr:hypothetical protein [Asticcacaulis sp. AC460]ESQ87436.1 hypothetical protein ABAC460_19105 [Asticcacaulis sp. AC460]
MFSLHHHDRDDDREKPQADDNRMGLLLLGVAALCVTVYSAFFFVA